MSTANSRFARQALCAMILAGTAFTATAQAPSSVPSSAPPAADKATATQPASKGCPPNPGNRKFNAAPIFDEIDTNHDGIVTAAEWKQADAPQAAWDFFRTNNIGQVKANGTLSRADFLAAAPAPGVDLNCDGTITLTELRTYAKRSQNQQPPGGAPPAAAPPTARASSAGR